RGFAHGFLVLSEEAIFTYKVDNVYAPHAEASIIYNDKNLDINWPIAQEQVSMSEKDKKAVSFKEAEIYL
ncbi:MAG: dTDP-4-dehydrorhamnose 3,5-epimerase family protein, partial [Bacteroides sp.]